ncbi:MAG: hypothetical protein LBG76_02170 [Treponema sp.]|nr:hypothetical protein [Treponema sp.]
MKRRRNSFLIAFFILSWLSAPEALQAAPYNSYMIDRDGFYRLAPALYEPSHVVNFDISGVNDLRIGADDRIYIARGGQDGAEILVFDEEENFAYSVGLGELKSAQGVFVDSGGLIYAADTSAGAVLVFSPEGELLRKIERPASPLFGAKTPFKPVKLAVDRQGNMYVLGEGSAGGIIQLDGAGEFLGYFGVSMTRVSLIRRIQNLLFPPELMENFIRAQPPSMTNIAIDGDGLVYAATKGDTLEPLKKINVAGKNLFDDSLADLYGEPALLALEAAAVDAYGNVYALSNYAGHIIILDSQGRTIGIFGAKSELNAEMGVTVNPVAIGINSRQRIYIADKGTGQIQVFTPSPLMETLFSALAFYREGRYVEGEELWRETLKRNAAIAVANNAIALSFAKKENYRDALEYFKLANNREGYSAAFWEVRQQFLMRNMRWAIIAFFVFIVLRIIWNRMKRASLLEGYYVQKKKALNTKLFKSLGEAAGVFRHPLNAFYGVAWEGAVSLPLAAVMAALAACLLLLSDYAAGFVFNTVNTGAGYMYSPIRTLIIYTGGFLLFVISNFLIASITNGHGSLSQVFRGASLALAPVVFFYLPLIFLSNALTLQEVFIYHFAQYFIFGWSGLLAIIMVMQIHDFDFREAIGNLLLTVFTMAVIFTVAVVIFMLARGGFEFFRSVIEEVYNRA